jgi:hypothetical protein
METIFQPQRGARVTTPSLTCVFEWMMTSPTWFLSFFSGGFGWRLIFLELLLSDWAEWVDGTRLSVVMRGGAPSKLRKRGDDRNRRGYLGRMAAGFVSLASLSGA